MSYKPNNYLMHHGIKGQRWGVRRFQNEDGSLTPEGQDRYNQLSDNQKKTFRKMDPKTQKKLLEDMDDGKSYSASVRDARRRAARKTLGVFLGLSLAAAGLVGASAYISSRNNQRQDDRMRESLRRSSKAMDETINKLRTQAEQLRNQSKPVEDLFRSKASVPFNSIRLDPKDYIIR